MVLRLSSDHRVGQVVVLLATCFGLLPSVAAEKRVCCVGHGTPPGPTELAPAVVMVVMVP